MAENHGITGRSESEAQKFDELAHCPKCGFATVGAKHVDDEQGERIVRTCQRCGYSWPERCLDDPEK